MRRQTPGLKGPMCAVGLGEAECIQLCKKHEGRIALAAVNSPSSYTLSSDAVAIKQVVEACAA
jgi:acyl transferase domain-containing protein